MFFLLRSLNYKGKPANEVAKTKFQKKQGIFDFFKGSLLKLLRDLFL